MTNHDAEQTSNWPVRTYRCTRCKELHQYKRALKDVPSMSSCCDAPMSRAFDADLGSIATQATTPIRDVRHVLRKEEREGKRPRAIDRDLNPHFATV